MLSCNRLSVRAHAFNVDPPVTYAVVLDTDDEVASELGRFVPEKEVEAASITAIGAFGDALLVYFDWQTKHYKKIVVDEQVEVFSLLGDLAVAEEGPAFHLHALLGRADGSVVGGHLLEAHVRPTLEVILTQPPSYLPKRRDPPTGLPLIAIGQ
jgi:predicted DNA-binding protein with PD1-like motif